MKNHINIHRLISPVSVLGYGRRAVIWVQGCSNNCIGCIAVDAKNPDGGAMYSIAQLKEWVLAQDDIEGITISGGEPFEQADALSLFLKELKEYNLGVICYTGLIYEEIRKNSGQKRLLDYIDLLIDGPYVREAHDDLLWRASGNQRFIQLTGRYKAILEIPDKSAGLEFFLDENNMLVYAGVPVSPDFNDEFNLALKNHEIILDDEVKDNERQPEKNTRTDKR